jgi:cation diffusion facilitator family transporter
MSAHGSAFSPPEEKRQALRRATRLQWITVAFLATIVAVIGAVMGSSEAMKAVWAEDLLSLVPPVAYLVSSRWRRKDPTDEFPYGYRRAGHIGYLAGAAALMAFGIFILVDSAWTLLAAEHPTIGTLAFRGHRIWLGWVMILALVYSVIPPFVLGRLKLPLAEELHEKALYTDSRLEKGDWLTGLAGIVGLLGIGIGFWWVDAAAAALIAVEILRDGVSTLKNSVGQLMNRRPTDLAVTRHDPILDRMEDAVRRLPWVREVRVRLREDGEVITGEVFVTPRDEERLMDRIAEATEAACQVDWRVHDMNVVVITARHDQSA